ncbi:MAG: hypothetical protein ACI84O_000096 [Myxococcota bacterium]|jgi:hypothetical protein
MRTTLTLLLVFCCQSLFAQSETNSSVDDLRLAELRMTTLSHSQRLETLEARDTLARAEHELNLFNSFGREETEKSLRLDLLREQDSLDDATQELEQLKIMYERNNIAEVTAQMVLDRAERSLLRQQISVALAQAEITKWTQLSMARAHADFDYAVTYAKLNLNHLAAEHTSSRAELSAEISHLKLAIAELRTNSEDE